MSTTPNMSMILPTDHDSNDVWGAMIIAALTLNDAHDHSTGKGVKVPSAGLNINADLTFSPAGTPFAATDIKAVDFAAVAASTVTGLSGALFLNSSDNELYWRNTLGTNVKLTLGSLLNIPGVGGIGGDYASVGALVDFIDANDQYRFRQQFGASVQQYARMASSDIDLYEYKAHPATPAPTNRVRIASPAALAASYVVTLPAALPAGGTSRLLGIDSAGAISLQPTLPSANAYVTIGATGTVSTQSSITDAYSADLAIAGSTGLGNTVVPGAGGVPSLTLGTFVGGSDCPVAPVVGRVITGWLLYLVKASGAGTITARLWDVNMLNQTSSQIGVSQTNGAAAPGFITLGQSGLSTTVASGHSYYIEVRGGGTNGDAVFGWTLTVTP